MTSRIKLKLLILAVVILLAYVTWYTLSYLKVRNQAVLSLASEKLSCPKDQIELGWSHQNNDGPSEILAKVCGKEGLVLCFDDTHKHGMWGQYFAFDLSCRMSR